MENKYPDAFILWFCGNEGGKYYTLLYTFDNRLPPDGYRMDHGAMNRDLAMGKSKNEVMDKCNRGDYDVKK